MTSASADAAAAKKGVKPVPGGVDQEAISGA